MGISYRQITYMRLEKKEIRIIDYAYAYAPEQEIGIWATSFGGATAGLAIGEQDVERKVDFS